ncbi:hypothetical protein KJ765_03070 [Candidatus Micrarchaeota archaeon]|nr:hypothetical protein [Candidatus Micrarchaeota archaeon]
MTRILFAAVLWTLIFPIVSAASINSPIMLEEYFNQGTHSGTEVVAGKLQLVQGGGQYVASGTWVSPAFDAGGSALWNSMEGSANWEAFGLNLIQNGGFEQPLEGYWYTSANRGTQDCTDRFSGSCSMKLVNPAGEASATFRSQINPSGGQESEQHNIFRVLPTETVHFTARLKTDIPSGKLSPMLLFMKKTADGRYYDQPMVGSWRGIPEVWFGGRTGEFVRFQGEWRMDEYLPNDGGEYYGYPYAGLEWLTNFAPTRTFKLDDIRIFKDSRIKVEARTTDAPDCTDISSKTFYGPRLLYDNEIAIPAPGARCIQFRLTFTRIDSTHTPELNSLSVKFSRAYPFTRPALDTVPAPFNYITNNVDSQGRVVLDPSDGELRYQITGKKAKFFGTQIDPIPDGFTPDTWGDYICHYAEKYGFNLIKMLEDSARYGVFIESEADVRAGLDKMVPLFRSCRAKGIRMFFRMIPNGYLNGRLGNHLCDAYYCGSFEFVDDQVTETFKEYASIIMNYQYDSRRIGDDPLFVFAELMNEYSLLQNWKRDLVDGAYNNGYVDRGELSPYWAEKLQFNFNAWVRQKYPTYSSLVAAWQVPGQGSPIVADDGSCNELTYSDPAVCHLAILKFSSYHSYDVPHVRYAARIRDLVEFIVQREERFYSQMKQHIQTQSTMLVAGGKPHWELFPANGVSTENLDLVDQHPYVTATDQITKGSKTFLVVTDQSVINQYADKLLGNNLWKGRYVGKAFVAGETGGSPFTQYAPEIMLVPTLGGHAGWDASILFMMGFAAWDVNHEGMGTWTVQRNSPLVALYPTASRLFRRDMPKAESRPLYMKRSTALSYPQTWPFYIGYRDPASTLVYDVSWASSNYGSDVLPSIPNEITPPYVASTGAMVYDTVNERVTVNTPGTQGGYGNFEGFNADLGFLSFSIPKLQGLKSVAVFATSLDNQPLMSSQDVLVTVSSNADNSKHLWDTYHRRAETIGENQPWGRNPVLMSTVETDITLSIAHIVTVYPLDSEGRRVPGQAFELTPSNGRVSFSSVPRHATPWYEITSECSDLCVEGEQTCVSDTEYAECGQYDADACTELGPPQPCGMVSCDAGIHLEGSCDKQCVPGDIDGMTCADCVPECICEEGWEDEDGDSVNGCEYCQEEWTCTEWSEGTCGTRTCADGNDCGTEDAKPEEERSCDNNVPSSPPPSGGNDGGSNYGGSPTPTPHVSPTDQPTPTETGQTQFVTIPETDNDIENAILELPDGEEKMALQQIIFEAKKLEKNGNTVEARMLWAKAKERLIALLANARANKANYYYGFGLMVVLIIVAAATYYASTLRKPPSQPPTPNEAIQLPALPSEPHPPKYKTEITLFNRHE